MNLLARCDDRVGVGHGHVMRQLALAEAWRTRGGDAHVVAPSLAPELRRRLDLAGVITHEVDDPEATADLAAELDAAWVALDGYSFGAEWQRALAARGCRTMVVDDHGLVGTHRVALIVDQNAGASADHYPDRLSSTRMLLGSRYALVRRPFLDARRPTAQRSGPVRRIAVLLGGSPSPEAVDTARRAMKEAVLPPGIDVVFVGSDGPVDDMASLLGDVDLALSAAGTTTWELSCLGVPSVIWPIAANQVPVAAHLGNIGAAVTLRADASAPVIADALSRLVADGEERQRLSERMVQLVDGRGAFRVVSAMKEALLRLRPAEEDDAVRLFDLANDRAVREGSFESSPIDWPVHRAWLLRRLRDPDTRLRVAFDLDGRFVGQVRIERVGRIGTVGVSVAPSARREGWAEPLVRAVCDQALIDGWVDVVEAHIKPENTRSIRSFEEAGFVPLEGPHIGFEAVSYVLRFK